MGQALAYCANGGESMLWSHQGRNKGIVLRGDRAPNPTYPHSLFPELHGCGLATATSGDVARYLNIYLYLTCNSLLEVKEFYYWTPYSILGSGSNGLVKLCSSRTTGLSYALKSISKFRCDGTDRSSLISSEIQIMSELDHPNILRLLEHFETSNEVYLILELCTGGHLLDNGFRPNQYHYPENVTCNLVKQMLRAITYLHSKHIVHCDLKMENFLFQSDSINSTLKLIDFGLSQYISPENPYLTIPTGTPYYAAPEVLAGKYDYKCDVWSIGVIVFKLLCGSLPFYGRTDGKRISHSLICNDKFESVNFHLRLF